MTALILFLAFFQTGDRTVPLRDGCSADDSQIAVVGTNDSVHVLGAIAGGDGECYHVDVTRDGKTTSGYLLGETLPAIAAFVAERERSSSERLDAVAKQMALPPPSPPSESAKEPSKEPIETFENFSGRDLKGKPVSLNSLPGRIIIVQFWGPHGSSKNELESLTQFYNQYKGRGVGLIGLVMVGPKYLGEALDDMILSFPEIPDPGLAKRYGVNPSTGKTFVLDKSHRILASGSANDAIRAVKKLITSERAGL